MNIEENLREIQKTIPSGTRLIAVSKTKPAEDISEAYAAGQRLFGENKALEMRDKHETLPKDIEWHFIGHLQRNKIKYIIPFVSMIHSIDSLELLQDVNAHAAKVGRVVDCLLQFHIATEETKFGLDMQEAEELLAWVAGEQNAGRPLNVRIVGVMGMATNTDNREQVRGEFRHLHACFDTLKSKYFAAHSEFKEISMGMSGDYEIAIEEGSTLVRVGSAIFGARNYAV
ncbi:MAG: YggS family pyridoxal phosphate-dependent enzyme [Bacteroidales bacterium]|nr:YggS family pyridoxal phosphate-dependent enzyme [Bacteroidales bacterium]